MNTRTLLHILLCITFFSAGVQAIAYFFMPQALQLMADNPTLMPEQLSIAIDQLRMTPHGFFYASALLYVLEIVGGIVMWRERWTGFHCYTLARLLLLLLPAAFLGWNFIGVGDVMFALLFVLAYLSLMRTVTKKEEE